jgi:hypothetical protein
MADTNELATGGVAGGVVAVITAIANAIGVRRRLRAVEGKTKRQAAELAEQAEHKDEMDARVQDIEAELEALREKKPMAADEVRALVAAEVAKLGATIQAELKKMMNERFAAQRDRLADIRRAIKRVEDASKKGSQG